MSFTKSPKYQGKIRTCIIQVCLNYCFGEIFSIVPGISHPPLIELIRVTKEWMIQLGDAKARTWLLGWPQRIHPSSTSWHDNCGVFLMFFFVDESSRIPDYWKLNHCSNSRVTVAKWRFIRILSKRMWSFWMVTLTMRQKASQGCMICMGNVWLAARAALTIPYNPSKSHDFDGQLDMN